MAKSTKRFEWPHSLSHYVPNFTKLLFNAMPGPTSKMDGALHDEESMDTTSTLVKSRTPFISPATASLTATSLSSYFAPSSERHIKSTTDT